MINKITYTPKTPSFKSNNSKQTTNSDNEKYGKIEKISIATSLATALGIGAILKCTKQPLNKPLYQTLEPALSTCFFTYFLLSGVNEFKKAKESKEKNTKENHKTGALIGILSGASGFIATVGNFIYNSAKKNTNKIDKAFTFGDKVFVGAILITCGTFLLKEGVNKLRNKKKSADTPTATN